MDTTPAAMTQEPYLSLNLVNEHGQPYTVEAHTEKEARELLAEMETWGDECSDSSKQFRDEMRAHFAKVDAPRLIPVPRLWIPPSATPSLPPGLPPGLMPGTGSN
jgi:hypothetical protein